LNVLLQRDVCEELFERSLYTGYNELSKDIDLVVRTSGERRLSDFMLWQGVFSCLVFLQVLWPDFSSIHFYLAILLYQKSYNEIQERKSVYSREAQHLQEEFDRDFLSSLNGDKNVDKETQLKQFMDERDQRINNFLQTKEEEYLEFIEELALAGDERLRNIQLSNNKL